MCKATLHDARTQGYNTRLKGKIFRIIGKERRSFDGTFTSKGKARQGKATQVSKFFTGVGPEEGIDEEQRQRSRVAEGGAHPELPTFRRSGGEMKELCHPLPLLKSDRATQGVSRQRGDACHIPQIRVLYLALPKAFIVGIG